MNTFKNRKNRDDFKSVLVELDELNHRILNRKTWDMLYNSNEQCAKRFIFANKLIAKKIFFLRPHSSMILQSTMVNRDLLELVGFEECKIVELQEKAVPFIETEMNVIVCEVLFLMGIIPQIALLIVVLAL